MAKLSTAQIAALESIERYGATKGGQNNGGFVPASLFNPGTLKALERRGLIERSRAWNAVRITNR